MRLCQFSDERCCIKQILDHGSRRTPGPGSKPAFQPLTLTLTQIPQYSVTSDFSPVLRRLALSSLYPRIPFLSFLFTTYETLYFFKTHLKCHILESNCNTLRCSQPFVLPKNSVSTFISALYMFAYNHRCMHSCSLADLESKWVPSIVQPITPL